GPWTVWRARPAALVGPAQHPVPADPQRVGGDAQINNERLAHDVRPRQESPEAAVVGLVAVVAHDPVMPGRDRDRAPIVGRRVVAGRVAPDVVGQVPGPDLPALPRIVRWTPQGTGIAVVGPRGSVFSMLADGMRNASIR